MLVTKLMKKLLDAESKPKHSFVLKETFVSKKGDSTPTSARTSEFMSKIYATYLPAVIPESITYY